VKIAAGSGLQTFGVPITAVNLGADLSIDGALPSAEVTVFGQLPKLQGLAPGDVTATIDLKDQDAGTVKVEVKVKAPEGVDVRSVQPAQVTVTLGQR
jgi:YbbR domain-containing protein